MVLSTIEKYEGVLYPSDSDILAALANRDNISNSTTENFLSNDPDKAKLIIATSLNFLTGIIHILIGCLNGGSLTKYMSNTIISSFTIASSCVILIGQIPILLDFKVASAKTPFKFIETLIQILFNLHQTNIYTFVLSLILISSLYLVNRLLNKRFQKRFKFSIPIELIVVS